MDKRAQIAQLFGDITDGKSGQAFFSAQVVSIQGDTCTISVDGQQLAGVRLKPTTAKTDSKVLLTPAAGSDVLVGSFSGDLSNLFVLSADVVDTVEVTCNGVNLMETISSMLDTIANAVIATPAGPGSFDPAVISSLKAIEMQFKQIFK
jgi:hypothetical protein